VSWLPPRFPNGIITKYRVAWKSDDLEGVKDRYYVTSGNEDQQMLMEVRRLKENKRFTFWVTPATSLGLGKPSEMLDVTVSNKGMFFFLSLEYINVSLSHLYDNNGLGWGSARIIYRQALIYTHVPKTISENINKITRVNLKFFFFKL
jgi:hypothetical protein